MLWIAWERPVARPLPSAERRLASWAVPLTGAALVGQACVPGYRLDAVFEGSVTVAGVAYESETYAVFVRDPSAEVAGRVRLHVDP